jgi:hypothetical protein
MQNSTRVIVVDQRSSVFQAISKIANLIRFRIPILLLKQTPFADDASFVESQTLPNSALPDTDPIFEGHVFWQGILHMRRP